MPMLTTVRIRWPVTPVHAPERTWSAKSLLSTFETKRKVMSRVL